MKPLLPEERASLDRARATVQDYESEVRDALRDLGLDPTACCAVRQAIARLTEDQFWCATRGKHYPRRRPKGEYVEHGECSCESLCMGCGNEHTCDRCDRDDRAKVGLDPELV